MGIKISIKKTWKENLCILLIILSFIEIQTEAIHDILKYPMISLGLIGLIGCFMSSKMEKKICVLIVAMIGLSGLELTLSEGVLATQYIWDLGICMPIALLIYKAKYICFKKWIILYLLISIYLLFRLVQSPDHYSIFYSHSRNYISVFEIFLMFMVAVAAYKSNRELPSWMYYFTVIVCILAIGRGGILAGFILLGGHIVQKIAKEKKQSNRYIRIMLLLLIFGVLVVFFIYYHDTIIQRFFPRFASGGAAADSSDVAVSKRLLMWGSYLDSCLHSGKLLFWGANPYPIVLKYHYRIDFNLHNSYLMMHVFYGLVGLIGAGLCSIKFLKVLIKEKSEIAVIFVSFLIRALTDHCFPGKLSAVIIWFAALFAICYSNKEHRRPAMKSQV